MTNGEFRRHNGFETPLDRLQILSYVLFAFMISSFYALLVPLTVEPSVRIALIVLYSALLLCLIYGAFTSSKIDPVDKTVNAQLQQTPREMGPGELLYCCFCKCKVHKRSKHCRVCNKCIGNFDHHCKWLNNCIGGENYRIFFFTISSASLLTGLQLAWNAVVLKRYLDDANLRLGVPHLAQQGSDAILAWLCIALVVSTMVFTLLVHLVIFHIFLNHQGISTYDYILKQRAKKAAKKEVCSTPRPFPSDTCWDWEGPRARKCVAVSPLPIAPSIATTPERDAMPQEAEMRQKNRSSGGMGAKLQETRIDAADGGRGEIVPIRGAFTGGHQGQERSGEHSIQEVSTASDPPHHNDVASAGVPPKPMEPEVGDAAVVLGASAEIEEQAKKPPGWDELPGIVAVSNEGQQSSPDLSVQGSFKKALKPLPPKKERENGTAKFNGGSSSGEGGDAL